MTVGGGGAYIFLVGCLVDVRVRLLLSVNL
jgi:hypothetical protein